MCWTWLKISGNPVFKTPRRHKWIKFINICYKGQFVLSVSLTVFDPQLHQILPYVGNPNSGIWQIFAWGIRNPRKFCRLNPEYWTLQSRIPIKIRIQNPGSTEKDWNPVPGIGNPRRGVQNPSLSWIPFLGVINGYTNNYADWNWKFKSTLWDFFTHEKLDSSTFIYLCINCLLKIYWRSSFPNGFRNSASQSWILFLIRFECIQLTTGDEQSRSHKVLINILFMKDHVRTWSNWESEATI